jgi:hypothetical protein
MQGFHQKVETSHQGASSSDIPCGGGRTSHRGEAVQSTRGMDSPVVRN